MLSRIQAALAGIAGDVWRSWRMAALWPYPAVVYGKPRVKFNWNDYRLLSSIIEPGDIILTRAAPFFFSNRAIPGAFKHVAVYTGAVRGELLMNGCPQIIRAASMGLGYRRTGRPEAGVYEKTLTHAISEGVVCQDLGHVMFEEDYVAVVRPWLDAQQQEIIVSTALAQLGKEYDFGFEADDTDAFFCSELGDYCCRRAACTPPGRTAVPTCVGSILLPWLWPKVAVPLADNFAADVPMVFSSVACVRDRLWKKSKFAETLRIKMLASGGGR